MNIVAGPTVSYLSIVMNTIIFVTLLDRKIRTPTTVIMQGLAVADALTALCAYGFEPLFSLHYEEIGISDTGNILYQITNELRVSIDETKKLVGLKFPYCLVHYCLSGLSDMFHLVSILLTTCLGLQKLMVCLIRHRTNIAKLDERKAAVVCVMFFIVSIIINIPKLFVVTLTSGKGDACVVSEPNGYIQKYVLTFYPILFTSILIVAVIAMLFSTLCISVTLYRLKRTGNTSRHFSMSTKKSFILTLCVMVVFLLSEVPRLYINVSLFNTYRSDLDKENIALNKVRTEIYRQSLSCGKGLSGNLINEAQERENKKVTKDWTCISGLDELPTDWRWVTDFIANVSVGKFQLQNLIFKSPSKLRRNTDLYASKLLNLKSFDFILNMKNIMPANQYDQLYEAFEKIASSQDTMIKQLMTRTSITLYCNGVREDIFMDVFFNISLNSDCLYTAKFEELVSNLPFLILGSTPYSEPMNYRLNIIWGHIDISLNHLKPN
ncbi:unnamed protein product [Mytilus coruscus]|uniref:G-protein coupled receptors family 1 profile domain-containing protein n=1 Tax=Mytilus coruscus TaxID=42192 RepID=A0A6J8B238_MYTCO|nr:unnamed protein product [Mytilus coruscus]